MKTRDELESLREASELHRAAEERHVARVLELARQGLHHSIIAVRLGRSAESVRRVLRRAGMALVTAKQLPDGLPGR